MHKVEEHFPRRRRESPSGKDPNVMLRYIVLLHLILRWKALGWDADLYPVGASREALRQ
jgi:hypothetical protein